MMQRLWEFDPGINNKETWQPPKAISSFLNKHFNHALSESEREAIMKDFPKPQSGGSKVRRPGKGSPQGKGQGPALWSPFLPVG
jgi:hypothetical protein